MDYNAYNNKLYSGVSTQPIPGSSGFFQATSAPPQTFLKVPNPAVIKQEASASMASGNLGETPKPPVNYSQNQHYVNHSEAVEPEKPVFYRKPFELQFIPNAYIQHPHAQQFGQHPQHHVHHQHQQHIQQQQQQQQHHHPQLQHPPSVPSHVSSPQQVTLVAQQQQQQHHQQLQQHSQHSPQVSSFHDYPDHSNASSVGSSCLEPQAYIVHRVPSFDRHVTKADAVSHAVPTTVPAADVAPTTPVESTPKASTASLQTTKARFRCDHCTKTFDTKAKLEKHAKIHQASPEEQQSFKCRMCDKIFRTKSTLICHEKVHGENGVDNSFSCVECGKVFASDDKLQVHRRLHTGEKPYQCKVCLKRFNHQSNLIVHSRIHDKVKKALKCDRCSKVLDNEERLAIHMRLHTGEKPYKCSYCDKRFNHKSTVSTHEKAAHIAANSFKCGRCHKTFNQKCQLQYHEKLQEEHTIACTLCEKVFCYKASHKEHMFKVHLPRSRKEQKRGEHSRGADGESAAGGGTGADGGTIGAQGRNKFKCTVCDRRFYYKRALEVHMGVHDASLDVNVLHFSCNYCPETFTEEEPLQRHESEHVARGTTDFLENMRALEQSENPANGQVDGGFRCPLCFKRFDDQEALGVHHRTHLCARSDCTKCERAREDSFDCSVSTYDPAEDRRETVCNICHRALPSFEQYQNHFHYHTSRVPFYCFHCRVEFNDKRELYTHSKTHSPRELESYTCEICAKVFSTKGNFKRHLKSHETVRAFACDRCFKQYDYKSALEAHLKRSHGIEL